MKADRSLILDEATRWLFPIIVLVSLYVTFRGHNAPGGGFAGGMIVGAGFVLRQLTGRTDDVSDSLAGRPGTWIGGGLLVAVVTAMVPLVVGGGLLESHIWKVDVPAIGEVKVVSSMFFDLGVYLLVIGVVRAVLVALSADPADSSGAETEVGGR
ncbi:MAG: MnhB domain-containing protein [Ilumatobacteraceae bacterium]